MSAHIDHIGVGAPGNGDASYNGALDNASGCAVLLDVAAQLKKEIARPRRSLLFVFFTGEEPVEMLGSKYFVTHPTVDIKSIAGDVNIDEVHAIVRMTALAVPALNESDMGDAARRAAASLNIPIDYEDSLARMRNIAGSDQYNFMRQGVPALKPVVGFPGDLAAVLQKWRAERYHKPSDDPNQPINLETAAKFEEFVFQLLPDLANDPHRPEWKPTSSYKR